MADERRSSRKSRDDEKTPPRDRERGTSHRSHRSRTRSRSRSRDRERDRRSRDYDDDRGRDRRGSDRSGRELDERSRRDKYRDDHGYESSRRSRHDRDSHRDRHRDSPDRHRHRDSPDRRREERRGDDRDGYGDRKRSKDSERHAMESKGQGSPSPEENDIDESVILRMEAGDEEEEAQKVLEESRKRREAIRNKYQSSAKPEEGPQQNGDEAKEVNATTILATSLPAQVPAAGREATENAATATRQGHDGKPSADEEEAGDDMFTDDIFGQSPAGGRQMALAGGVVKESAALMDNWDDPEGYYAFRAGEMLDERYEVISAHGRGVFSSVVKAIDLKAPPSGPKEVAIKIIRSNETMTKAGQQELVILKKLSGADPEDRRHCVRLLSSFQFRGHLCLVFESLEMNLREVLKKYGRNIGIKLGAVRAYATQLFLALKHLRNCGVLHCDIKPDNMLVNEAKNILKLADFGSAMFTGDNEITPYLVSRFYRAPEIMLGLTYDHALDMWSVGCCLYELYTGKMLFPGRNNNDMLRLHIEAKGPFPKKLLKKAAFVDQHFDSDFNFCALEEDPINPAKTVKRILTNVKPKDMGALLATSGSSNENSGTIAAFRDLLDKIFALDADKRLTASQALNHPFILGK